MARSAKFAFVAALLVGFGPLAGASTRVTVEKAARVQSVSGGVAVELPAGQGYDWSGNEALAIFQEGSLPIVLVPAAGQDRVRVNAIPLDNRQAQGEADRVLGDLLQGITAIQKLAREHHFDAAYTEYDALRVRFPQVRFLDFIGASLQALLGHREQARVLTTQALRAHPEFADGKKFLRTLGGDARD